MYHCVACKKNLFFKKYKKISFIKLMQNKNFFVNFFIVLNFKHIEKLFKDMFMFRLTILKEIHQDKNNKMQIKQIFSCLT